MTTIEKLQNIARGLDLSDAEKELKAIESRTAEENAPLIMPLVGEFSSGKTTLINALTDSKTLETATKPTTATIYKVHFGCETCRATILNENNELIETQDLSGLKNEALADAKVVTLFDTSTRVPSSTILIDTPGLSSFDPKHKQTLVDFLPSADGILLVSDINQQITRSLTDFIEMMKLSMRPIYLILTKSDTKSPQEIIAAKQYISNNCKVPLARVAVVSAAKDDLNEVYDLLDTIQKEKKEIIEKVDAQHTKSIINYLLQHIQELLKSSSSDKEMDNAIREVELELNKINRNIDNLIEDTSEEIADIERSITRKFEDIVSTNLNTLVTNGQSDDFDSEAISMINSTHTLLVNEYKNKVQESLVEKARGQKGTENKIYLDPTEGIDLAGIQINGFSYNIDLNNMGHEYDGYIKSGIIVASAAAAIAVTAATGGAGGAAIGTAIEAADVVADVGSIAANRKLVNRIGKGIEIGKKVSDNYVMISEADQQIGRKVGRETGFLDSMAGFIAEKTMSKPKRLHAIRDYMGNTLTPEFKTNLHTISNQLVDDIRIRFQEQSKEILGQKKDTLNQLKSERKEKNELFEEKISKLREYKTTLLTL